MWKRGEKKVVGIVELGVEGDETGKWIDFDYARMQK